MSHPRVSHPRVAKSTGLLVLVMTVNLIATTLAPALPASADTGPEQITNGSFDTDLSGWNAYPAASVVDGRGCIDVPAGPAPTKLGCCRKCRW